MAGYGRFAVLCHNLWLITTFWNNNSVYNHLQPFSTSYNHLQLVSRALTCLNCRYLVFGPGLRSSPCRWSASCASRRRNPPWRWTTIFASRTSGRRLQWHGDVKEAKGPQMIYGGFHFWVPKNGWFIGKMPWKWMMTGGTPHFRKPPYSNIEYVELCRCSVLTV